MDATGCDCMIDVHGDEELPYNFVSGAQGVPAWSPRLAHLTRTLCESYVQASPFFQVGHGYDNDDPGTANLAICTNQIAQRFNCLSATLEMPYKDLVDMSDAPEGWNPQKCASLGAAMLDALAAVRPLLRAEIAEADIAALPAWVQPSYKNPSWEEPSYSKF